MRSDRVIAVASLMLLSWATPSHAALSTGVTFLPIPGRRDMAYDGAHHILYVTAGASLVRYDVAAKQFLTPVTLGGTLQCIAISPDGRTLAVADAASTAANTWIHQYDIASGTDTLVNFTKASGESGTYSVAYGSDGKVLVTSGYAGSGWAPLRRYDPVAGTSTTIGNPRQNTMLSASGDRNTIAMVEANISSGPLNRYSVATGQVTQGAGTGWFVFEVGTSRDGSQYAVPTYNGTYVYDSQFQQVAKVGTYASNGPIGVAYSPTADVVYFSWYSWQTASDEVVAYSTTTFAPIESFHVGGQFNWIGNGALGEGRLKTSDDGRLLFATVDDGVSIINVPEPHAAGLSAAAAAGFALLRRNRRK
jgi:hypothetical protein